ncbi:MAG: hypothetical protein H6849_03365 [Alphaproteobacteria bacterium]|nr:MAG: hypothetical protein H6849_03365 [Alphaproteobacteria bacterium]
MSMPFDYDAIVQEALLESIARILKRVAQDGLQNDHHFYITFRTDRDDVKIPAFLRERHPYEITIVIQHMFWDLKVNSDGFAVTLSFNNAPETIEVPFSALISFVDPSVQFGLHFVPSTRENPDGTPSSRDEGLRGVKITSAGTPTASVPIDTPPPTLSGEKVVQLDRFRK